MAKQKRGAGRLRERIRFERRQATDDGYGNSVAGDWQAEFEASAELKPRLGSEAVMAARLQGLQPYTMTIRSSATARQVTPSWRCVNKETGAVYNIKTIVDPEGRNAWLELLVVTGGAT